MEGHGGRRTFKLLLDRDENSDHKVQAVLSLGLAIQNKHGEVMEILLQYKKATSPKKLPRQKKQCERLDKSQITIIYKELKHKD